MSTVRRTSCSTTCRTPAAWRSGPTVCVGSPPPTSLDCGWHTTGSVRKPRSTRALIPTPRPAPSTLRAPGLGRRLLGHVRCRTRTGTEEPQGDCRVPPPQRPAGDPGLDELRRIDMTATTPRGAALLPAVSLIDVSTYLPGEPIGADYYAQFADSDELRDNLMFRAPKFRHHVAQDETAIDMVERAAAGLVDRHGADVLADV